MRLLTKSDLADTDNIVSFENTTPINLNKKVKIKNAEQIDQIKNYSAVTTSISLLLL